MPAAVTELAVATLSPDGAHLLAACWDGAFSLWHCATGACVRRWHRPRARCAPRWSHDGRHVALRSFRGEGVGDYTLTVLDPFTGAERLVADLDPDDGGALGFDWTPDSQGLVFADTFEGDGLLRTVLHVVALPQADARVDLPRDRPRPGVTLPPDVPATRVLATAAGFFCAHEGEACMVGPDGAVRWRTVVATDAHVPSPARNAIVSFSQHGPQLRTLAGALAALDAPYGLGNALVWSRDGSTFALNAALPSGPGYAVFREGALHTTVADAQPHVPRGPCDTGYFFLDGWHNAALDHGGARFFLADNERGELRAWSIDNPARLLWRTGLDDLSFVQCNGPTVVAASATQLMFVDGDTGRVIARGSAHG